MIRELWKRYRDGGFGEVWRWIKNGGRKRWRAATNWSKRAANRVQAKIKKINERLRWSHNELKRRKDKKAHLDAQIKAYVRRIKDEKDVERRNELQKELQKIREDRDKARRSIKEIRKFRNRTFDEKARYVDKFQGFVRAHVIYRRRWKAAQRKHRQEQEQGGSGGGSGQPQFEPWMANGRNWVDASQWARNFVARAVVIDGNYCTSMARDYVPPGGSTTSHHLIWNGGKAADVGPSAKTQQREYNLGLGNGNYLELFGPMNSVCLKYGNQITLGEGTGLENLHDTHNHGAGN